jgi:hypothetical protein
MRLLISAALGSIVVAAAVLVMQASPGFAHAWNPSNVGTASALTIHEAIKAMEPAPKVTVSGYLALDKAACGRATNVPTSVCSGAFLWEQPVSDPWYGGSRLMLTVDDVSRRLAPALGVRDWGVPVLVTGVLTNTTCRSSEVCVGELYVESIALRGHPIPAEFPGDQLTTPVTKRVADSRVLAPATWSIADAVDHWTISSPGGEVSMALQQRATRLVPDDSASVFFAYPEAHSIAYEYGDGIVVWRVDTGDTTATRKTIVGYDDGTSTYELTLSWADAGVWIGASNVAITRMIEAMTGSDEGISR